MRSLIAVLALLSACQLPALARADDYPNHPIRIIVPFDPGGPNDALARIYGQKLTERWGQAVIVESRPGAAGVVGMRYVASSPPDGYTLVINYLGNAMRAGVAPPTPYDLKRDFAPIAALATTPFVLIVDPSVPVHSVAELVALSKSRPEGLTFASSGLGSPSHLAGELLRTMAGANLVHVPYKGQGPSTLAVVEGNVQFVFASPVTGLTQVKSGRVRALAVSGDKRLPFAPDVPTVAESGVPNFDVQTWDGLAAPAGTPDAIVNKLADEIARVQAMPDVQQRLALIGLQPLTEGPAVFRARIAHDITKWTAVMKEAHVTMQ
jgi:tripartite-type tricarboxylate transporter receptor subunit TctC